MNDWIGYVAAILTTSSFFAQAVKTIRSRRTKDISLWMYLLFCAGITLWLVYGLVIQSAPVIVANIATLALSGMILVMKLKNG
jgi:MtN3 and saliva related transmembrane protein